MSLREADSLILIQCDCRTWSTFWCFLLPQLDTVTISVWIETITPTQGRSLSLGIPQLPSICSRKILKSFNFLAENIAELRGKSCRYWCTYNGVRYLGLTLMSVHLPQYAADECGIFRQRTVSASANNYIPLCKKCGSWYKACCITWVKVYISSPQQHVNFRFSNILFLYISLELLTFSPLLWPPLASLLVKILRHNLSQFLI